MKKYRGIVVDQLDTLEKRKTMYYDSYAAAHQAAERLCKRTYGERGTIDIEAKVHAMPAEDNQECKNCGSKVDYSAVVACEYCKDADW